MDQSQIYQILIAASKATKKCADGKLEKVFEDEFCVVFQDGYKQVTVGTKGDVYVKCGSFDRILPQGQEEDKRKNEKFKGLVAIGKPKIKREERTGGSLEKEDMEVFNFDRPTRESNSPRPNSFNVKWLRGQKSELERVNSLESLLFTCNSNIKL
jgi:hypothetical protein